MPPEFKVNFPSAVAVISVPVTPESIRSFESLTVIFVPLALTVPKLFVLLFRVTLPAVPVPDETKFAVPLMIRLPAPVCVIVLPEIRVRFVPNVALIRLMASVFTIAPVVLLPIVSSLQVIRPISADVRPSLAELSPPPRFTPAPSVWISTFPAKVALTVPVRFMLLAVRVIKPALEYILDPEL